MKPSARRWAAVRRAGSARRPSSSRSEAVFEVFRQTTPLVEGISIDEAFLDVGGLAKISGSPPAIAARLRREVLRKVGLPITVGVARTKFLAKVASAVATPDGLLVVEPERELAFLQPLLIDRHGGAALDATIDDVRDRFGTRAVTRAVLLNRDEALVLPMLPDERRTR